MKTFSRSKRDLLKHSLVDISIHFCLAVVIAFLIYHLYRSRVYVTWFFAGAIFIDLDHIPEYLWYSRGRIILQDFFSSACLRSGKAYVLFHSWEINLVLFFLGVVFSMPQLTFLALGLCVHLAADNFHKQNIFCYLLAYRIIKKFKAEILFPEFTA
ncbi:MAG: hypothetical protein ACOY3D_02115 [Candidatus Omnitrophota bacterium]